jgi:hypothetical protein
MRDRHLLINLLDQRGKSKGTAQVVWQAACERANWLLFDEFNVFASQTVKYRVILDGIIIKHRSLLHSVENSILSTTIIYHTIMLNDIVLSILTRWKHQISHQKWFHRTVSIVEFRQCAISGFPFDT